MLREIAELLKVPRFAGSPVTIDYLWRASLEGRIFVASDADQNDTVTGQTSFANTTPTFQLQVPNRRVAMPLWLNLSQTGAVAGAAIDVIIEIDVVERFSTGGTSEKVLLLGASAAGGGMKANACTFRSGATASAGYGIRLWAATIGQDVSPAEGAVSGPFWKPEMPYPLRGPAAWNIYTYAATTGPTWFWSAGWIEWTAEEWDALQRQQLFA